jgi:putative ABC transport system substrate-binding protein
MAVLIHSRPAGYTTASVSPSVIHFDIFASQSLTRGGQMQRSRRAVLETIGGVTASTALWPGVLWAQKAPVVGYLETISASVTGHLMAEFHRGLNDAGYIEGKNVSIEYRFAERDHNKLPGLAAELVQKQVAVIAAINTPSVFAAKAATQTIPIVFGTGIDPVKYGFVTSLNRPSGNLTGVTQLNNEMEAKRVQLLHELTPSATTIAMLVNQTNPAYSEEATEAALATARALGVRLLLLNARDLSEVEAAFARLVQERVGLLLVSGDSVLVSLRDEIVTLAARLAIPSLYHRREFTVLGGLMSYGPSLGEAFYQIGGYVGRILNGAKPADLPVQQPTKFSLAINLKTARALGLTIPPSCSPAPTT